jgi:hypothetical protein
MRRLVLTLLAALGLTLAATPDVRAAYDPVGSGTTTLKFAPTFLAVLKANGVRISAKASATAGGGALSFPVAGGKFDPGNEKGTVEHAGMALLEGKSGSVSFKDLQLKTTRASAPISVRLGGGQLKLGTATGLAVNRVGFGEKITVSTLSLSAKVATRLSKRLHLKDAFHEGMPLGSVASEVIPAEVTIVKQGRVSLELDSAFALKLSQLHVAVNPIFPAEHPGPFTLAVFGGRVAPDLSSGTLETQGGLELLQLAGGQAIWGDAAIDLGAGSFSPNVDIEPTPPYAGKIGRVAVAGLTRDGAAVSADPRARTIGLSGARLTLAAATAATFNEAFAKPQGKDSVFAAGEPVGQLSFALKAQ